MQKFKFVIFTVIIASTCSYITGCATQTHPSPQTGDTVIDNSQKTSLMIDQLVTSTESIFSEQILQKQIELQRLTADSFKLVFSSNDTFSSGSSKLTETMKQQCAQLTSALITEQTVVQVVGHTDSSGAEVYNQTLSEKRAAAVQDFMISNGIQSDKVISSGLGESSPRADNTTASGRALNRRTEIYVRGIIEGDEKKAYALPQ